LLVLCPPLAGGRYFSILSGAGVCDRCQRSLIETVHRTDGEQVFL
jgi:hypothetical protein